MTQRNKPANNLDAIPGDTIEFIKGVRDRVGTVVVGGISAMVIIDNCSETFSSSGAGDSIAMGQGSLAGSCSGTVSFSYSGSYLRVGDTETDTVSGTINGTPATVRVVCVWVPTSAPNVASYSKVCVWVPL